MCVMENYVPWEKHPVEDCYHIYSDGTRVSVLFERDEDKVYGMNLIAVLAFKYHIRVYCDVVMDTHFHLVGKGDPENIHRFVAEMKRLLTRYFRQTHRPELVKEGIWIKADPLPDDQEVMRKIIYVFRNPLDAGDPLLKTGRSMHMACCSPAATSTWTGSTSSSSPPAATSRSCSYARRISPSRMRSVPAHS